MRFFELFLFVARCRRVLAAPLPRTITTESYIPLVVISVSLLLLAIFFAVKFVYMNYRRIGTIHAPGSLRSVHAGTDLSSSTSSFRFRDKEGDRHRGLLVGCLGSPAWETNLMSLKLGGATRRGSSFAYQLHTRSTRSASTAARSKSEGSAGSRFSKPTVLAGRTRVVDPLGLSLSSGSSKTPLDGGTSTTLGLVQHGTLTAHCGDFGEFCGRRLPERGIPNVARRASPPSVRLVDGPSHSSRVAYSFLSALPPDAAMVSPLMGTRDSIQLSRCSLKASRRPAPPMPSLPSFLPFVLPEEPHSLQASEYLPPLRFSPLAGVAKVFYSQLERKTPGQRVPDPGESRFVVYSNVPRLESSSARLPICPQEMATLRHVRKTSARSNHTRSPSCMGLAPGEPLPRTVDEIAALSLKCTEGQTSVQRASSGSSRDSGIVSKKPLKSCLRRTSAVSVPLSSSEYTRTPSISETSTKTFGTVRSTGDQASLRTPIPDVDIGLLGLDRFHWNEEIKELKVRSSHMRKDSVALVPVWE